MILSTTNDLGSNVQYEIINVVYASIIEPRSIFSEKSIAKQNINLNIYEYEKWQKEYYRINGKSTISKWFSNETCPEKPIEQINSYDELYDNLILEINNKLIEKAMKLEADAIIGVHYKIHDNTDLNMSVSGGDSGAPTGYLNDEYIKIQVYGTAVKIL